MLKMNYRIVRAKEDLFPPAIANCPFSKKCRRDYCEKECPMRSGSKCVYRVIPIAPLREAVEAVNDGGIIYVWQFDCRHCGFEVTAETSGKSLIGSRLACDHCGAAYLCRDCERTSKGSVYHMAVSRRRKRTKIPKW